MNSIIYLNSDNIVMIMLAIVIILIIGGSTSTRTNDNLIILAVLGVWIYGIVLAESIWSILAAIFFIPYAFYLVIDHIAGLF